MSSENLSSAGTSARQRSTGAQQRLSARGSINSSTSSQNSARLSARSGTRGKVAAEESKENLTNLTKDTTNDSNSIASRDHQIDSTRDTRTDHQHQEQEESEDDDEDDDDDDREDMEAGGGAIESKSYDDDNTDAELARYNQLIEESTQQIREQQGDTYREQQEEQGAGEEEHNDEDQYTQREQEEKDATLSVSSIHLSTTLTQDDGQQAATDAEELVQDNGENENDGDVASGAASPLSSSSSAAPRTWADVSRAKAEYAHLQAINKQRQKQIAVILEMEKRKQGQTTGSSSNNHHQHQTSSIHHSTTDIDGNKTDTTSNSTTDSPANTTTTTTASTTNTTNTDVTSTTNNTSSTAPIKTDYIKLLNQLNQLWEEIAKKQQKNEVLIESLITTLNAQDQRGEQLLTSLRAFQREMSKTAIGGSSATTTTTSTNTATTHTNNAFNTNKLTPKLMDHLIQQDDYQNKLLSEIRLVYLQVSYQIQSLQHAIKKKEQLAEGLHLIDFEQLKIENATLHEKIEERQDEIFKLKKKKNKSIEMVTHMKEKIWAIHQDNAVLQQEMIGLDESIRAYREEIKQTKAVRAEIRRENEVLKMKEGFVGVDALVADYEHRKMEMKERGQEVSGKQQEWQEWERRRKEKQLAEREEWIATQKRQARRDEEKEQMHTTLVKTQRR